MASTALEKEYPVLTHKKLDAETKSVFSEEIQSFRKTIEENKDLNSYNIANAKAALNLLKRKDYVDNVGIFNMIYFQQGRQVRFEELQSTREKGPIDNVVSSAENFSKYRF